MDVKTIYAITARIEELDTIEVLDILHSLGGWPTLGNKHGGNWNESKFDLVTDIVMLRRYSAAPFINMYVSTDDKKLSDRIIRVSFYFHLIVMCCN